MRDWRDTVRWLAACACTLPLLACAGGADIGGDKSSFGSGQGGSDAQGTGGVGSNTDPSGDVASDSNSGVVTMGFETSTGTGGGGDCIDADGDLFGDGCIAGDDCNDDDVDINPGVM